MSLRNGLSHSLRGDIIMRNLKYGKWRKEINQTGKHSRVSAALFFFWRQIEGATALQVRLLLLLKQG